jgi:hypothetical protein
MLLFIKVMPTVTWLPSDLRGMFCGAHSNTCCLRRGIPVTKRPNGTLLEMGMFKRGLIEHVVPCVQLMPCQPVCMLSPSGNSCDQKAKWYSFGNGNVQAGPHRTCSSICVQLMPC